MHAVQLAGKRVKGAFAQTRPVLPHGGKGRRCVPAQGNIIETEDADVLRDPQTQLGAMDHHTVGQKVVAADDGGAAFFQKAGQMFLQADGKQ